MRQKEEKGEGVFNAKKFVGHFGFQEKGQVGNWVFFGWSRMALVGKPMAKSKWVGVELISSSTQKGPYLVRVNLSFANFAFALTSTLLRGQGPPFGSFIIIIDFIIHTHVAPSIMHTKYYHSSVLFFFPLLRAMQFVTLAN